MGTTRKKFAVTTATIISILAATVALARATKKKGNRAKTIADMLGEGKRRAIPAKPALHVKESTPSRFDGQIYW